MRWPAPKSVKEAKYDPDDVVRGLTEYYQLLSSAGYLPADEIRYPPPGGWTDDDVAVSVLKGMNYTKEVIDLYRRIPYVPNDKIHVWPDTSCLSWLKDEDNTHAGYLEDFQRDGWALYAQAMPGLPPYMATLSYGEGSAGEPWVVDTKSGLMIGIGGNPEIMEDFPEGEEYRQYRSYPIQYFFDHVKADITGLFYVPTPNGEGDWYSEIKPGKSEHNDRMRAIYREHGWPDLGAFRKDECVQALLAYREVANRHSDSEGEWEDEDEDEDANAADADENDNDDDNDDDDDDDDDDDYEYHSEDPSGSDEDDENEEEGDGRQPNDIAAQTARLTVKDESKASDDPSKPSSGEYGAEDGLNQELQDLKADMTPAERKVLSQK